MILGVVLTLAGGSWTLIPCNCRGQVFANAQTETLSVGQNIASGDFQTPSTTCSPCWLF